MLSRRAGAGSVDGSALAVAVCVTAVLSLPFGIADAGAALLRPWVLLAGLGVAVLSAVLPYSFEFAALRRLPAGVVGVLVCLEPAVAGVAGYLVLAERLGPAAWIGIGCVVTAAAGSRPELLSTTRWQTAERAPLLGGFDFGVLTTQRAA